MSNPSKGPKYLNRTVKAILQLIRVKKRREVSVKIIRQLKRVDGANGSAVRFYTEVLTFLEREGV